VTYVALATDRFDEVARFYGESLGSATVDDEQGRYRLNENRGAASRSVFTNFRHRSRVRPRMRRTGSSWSSVRPRSARVIRARAASAALPEVGGTPQMARVTTTVGGPSISQGHPEAIRLLPRVAPEGPLGGLVAIAITRRG
jgi:hypothetical protein